MAHHEIQVILVDGTPIPQIPPTIRVDDTVSYTSVDGEVTITFELPFSNTRDVIREGETRRMTRAGNFFCKCSLTLPSGTVIEWSPERPKAGGEHDVRP